MDSRGESRQHVFTYGTLMRGHRNNYLLTTGTAENGWEVTFVGTGHTQQRFPLVQAGTYMLPYLLLLPGRGEHVEGEIYSVNDAMLTHMDKFEDHPNYYERQKLTVVLLNDDESEKVVDCWAYFLKNHRPELEEMKPLTLFTGNKCRMPGEFRLVQRGQVQLT